MTTVTPTQESTRSFSKSRYRRAPAAPMRTTARVGGMVAPGFEDVRTEFERNFTERGEIGAAVAAYRRGEKVVDLWGGRRAPGSDAPWNEDTMVVVNSITKGLAAMTLALANSRGWLDYDVPVARYWPEFAQHGKEHITVRQLLGHEAGLVPRAVPCYPTARPGARSADPAAGGRGSDPYAATPACTCRRGAARDR